MSTIYGKYLSMLGLLMKLSSILFHLIVNSVLPLLYDVRLTVGNYSILIRIFQWSNQNSESHSDTKSKVAGKTFFLQHIKRAHCPLS